MSVVSKATSSATAHNYIIIIMVDKVHVADQPGSHVGRLILWPK